MEDNKRNEERRGLLLWVGGVVVGGGGNRNVLSKYGDFRIFFSLKIWRLCCIFPQKSLHPSQWIFFGCHSAAPKKIILISLGRCKKRKKAIIPRKI